MPVAATPIPLPVTRVAAGSTTGGFVSVYDKGVPLVVNATPFGGYTGAIAGRRPYSPWKIAFAVVVALLVGLTVLWVSGQQ